MKNLKRLVIIVEGETEVKFCKKILFPFLPQENKKNCFKIKKTNGGLVNYNHLKGDIQNCINQNNILLTTMIDFYELPQNFPNYQNCMKQETTDRKISCLKQAIYNDISNNGNKNYTNIFIPYIAKHEFEALVFADISILKNHFEKNEFNQTELEKLKKIPNIAPEEINNNRNTAPSKRLKRIKNGYSKTIDGIAIIEKTGIEALLQKCPRFKKWVEEIKQKLQS